MSAHPQRARTQHQSASTRRPRFRPWLECLEERQAPVNITWIGAGGSQYVYGGGNSNAWDDPLNWYGGVAPGEVASVL